MSQPADNLTITQRTFYLKFLVFREKKIKQKNK